jgi:hypothetical protein
MRETKACPFLNEFSFWIHARFIDAVYLLKRLCGCW